MSAPATPEEIAAAVRAAKEADNAWSVAGQRLFGKRWGDVRYTPAARGEPGSDLRLLYETWAEARAAMHRAWGRSQ